MDERDTQTDRQTEKGRKRDDRGIKSDTENVKKFFLGILPILTFCDCGQLSRTVHRRRQRVVVRSRCRHRCHRLCCCCCGRTHVQKVVVVTEELVRVLVFLGKNNKYFVKEKQTIINNKQEVLKGKQIV